MLSFQSSYETIFRANSDTNGNKLIKVQSETRIFNSKHAKILSILLEPTDVNIDHLRHLTDNIISILLKEETDFIEPQLL